MDVATPAPAGDNSAALSDEDREVLFFHHLGLIGAIDDKLAVIREERKNARKLAKADGFELGDEIDLGLKIRSAEDESIIAASLSRRLRIASYFGLPVDHQFELFGGDRAPAVDKAFDAGVKAALLGKNPDPPHDPSTEQHQAWLRGWHKGQERMREAMQRRMEAQNAEATGEAPATSEETPAPKKRGRPKKNANAAPDKPGDEGDVRPRFKQNDAGAAADDATDPFPEARGSA